MANGELERQTVCVCWVLINELTLAPPRLENDALLELILDPAPVSDCGREEGDSTREEVFESVVLIRRP